LADRAPGVPMTDTDLMLLIGAYAAACVLANPKAERETAAKLRAAIQAYGDGRVRHALEAAAKGRTDFFWQTGPQEDR